MHQIALLVVVISTVWFVCGLYFQYAVRPLLLDRARFGVFATRDKLRAAAICGEIDEDSFTYQSLERMLNKMVHACGWFSFSVLIEYKLRKAEPSPDLIKELTRFDKEASSELKRMERSALRQMGLSILANSLGWMIFGAALYMFERMRVYMIKQLETTGRLYWHGDAFAVHAR